MPAYRVPVQVVSRLEEALRVARMEQFGSGFPEHVVTEHGVTRQKGDYLREETRLYRETWLIPQIEAVLAWAKGDPLR